jgi:hypothetical protein
MTTAAAATEGKPGEVPAAEPPKPAAEPPKPPAVVAPVVPAAEPPKPAAQEAPVELADDAEPKPGQRISMTSEAMRKRIERGTKASLKEEFGTDDPKVLKDKLARLDKFEADAEASRQAQLTKEQKLEEKATAAEQRATAAEQRALEVEEQHEVSQADTALRDSLKDTIKPKYWRHVREDLATWLSENHDPEKLDAMNDSDREKIVTDWAAAYAKENPEFAVTAAIPVPEPKPAVAAKVPLTNGVTNPQGRGANAKPTPVAIATGKFAGKTAAPGHPNSMSPAEFAEWKRATGNNF